MRRVGRDGHPPQSLLAQADQLLNRSHIVVLLVGLVITRTHAVMSVVFAVSRAVAATLQALDHQSVAPCDCEKP